MSGEGSENRLQMYGEYQVKAIGSAQRCRKGTNSCNAGATRYVFKTWLMRRGRLDTSLVRLPGGRSGHHNPQGSQASAVLTHAHADDSANFLR